MRLPVRLSTLVLLTTGLSAFWIAYVLRGVPISDGAETLTSVSFCLFTILWVESDAHRRGRTPCHEFGFLVYLFFPLSIVWYLFWTRGARGILVMIALLALFGTPAIVAALTCLAMGR